MKGQVHHVKGFGTHGTLIMVNSHQRALTKKGNNLVYVLIRFVSGFCTKNGL